MDWSWSIALWKAFRSALLAALAVAVASGTIDVFFDSLSMGLNPVIPVWSVPLAAAVLTLLRNFIKQWVHSAK